MPNTTAMISTRSLAALRVAATLTHTLPNLGARVRVGRRVVLDVRPAPLPVAAAGAEGPKIITSCAFRCSVAHAHQRHLAGEQLSFLGLPLGCEPVIDIGTPLASAVRPGGIYRVRHGEQWMWGMATTLAPDMAYTVGLDLVEEALPMDELHVLGLRSDPGTDVTLAYAETCAAPDSSAESALVELMVALLARWTAHELMEAVQDPGDARGVDRR
jgi:hypothetical protein